VLSCGGMKERLKLLQALCKQRGFIFPSCELYGGFANSFDFGPLGTQLKKNLHDAWWKRFVQGKRVGLVEEEGIVEEKCFALDSSMLMPNTVWRNSGHLENFCDPLVDCKKCRRRFRADDVVEQESSNEDMMKILRSRECPCGKVDPWGNQVSDIRTFNLMFETNVGPVVDAKSQVFLRPETAQGAYINFGTIAKCTGARLPFGVAQTGKAFRNEITPRNYIFRTREFEQMEMQWFCDPNESEGWFEYWLKECEAWLHGVVGIRKGSVRMKEHPQGKLAHYAKRTVDMEFEFPFGWGELWGISDRGTHDLTCHSQKFTDPVDGRKLTPAVIEPALGLSRLVLAVLCDAFTQEEGEKTKRTVLRLNPSISPISVALLPLIKNNVDHNTFCDQLSARMMHAMPDAIIVRERQGGSAGKRYRRHDEIGTPFCITIDDQTSQDDSVTVRERDSMKQIRVSMDELARMNAINNIIEKFDSI